MERRKVMSKLSLKPNFEEKKLKTWEDLESQLKFAFDERLTTHITNINPSHFEMSREEITSELKASGYEVIEQGEYLIIR
ncbi:TPA: hypothetical protein ACIN5M_002036, partial [Streptococcus agalactiae]